MSVTPDYARHSANGGSQSRRLPGGEGLTTRMLQVAVVAAPRHRAWRDDWCRDIRAQPQLRLQPSELPEPASAQGIPPCSGPCGECDAVLMLVNPDSVPWARGVLPGLRTAGLPTVLVARSLRASAMRDLLRSGASDFVAARCSPEELLVRLGRLCATPARAGQEAAPEPPATPPMLAGLVGSSPLFLRELGRIPVFAACDAGVLVLGESGTGKELCAQAVHYLSARAGHPWVAVNCGALPPDLVESELFGHVRGAFTHAHETRTGLVAEAAGGTLFLDEVDSMPPLAQVKLLRFLQDKEFRRVGSSRVERADVRVIAASNADLAQLAAAGTFRADLFYRLNVLTLHLPALRERREDVLALAQHFVEHYAGEFGRPVRSLSQGARERLLAHTWPGNVRELQHAIERGVLLAPGHEVLADDLGLGGAAADSAPPADEKSFQAAKACAVEDFERAYIERLLARCGGNITHAAEAAAKNRRAFWELIRKYGIDSGKFRDPH